MTYYILLIIIINMSLKVGKNYTKKKIIITEYYTKTHEQTTIIYIWA